MDIILDTKILTIEKVEVKGIGNDVVFHGTDDDFRKLKFEVKTKLPISILPNIERKFTTDDPFGEEQWEEN